MVKLWMKTNFGFHKMQLFHKYVIFKLYQFRAEILLNFCSVLNGSKISFHSRNYQHCPVSFRQEWNRMILLWRILQRVRLSIFRQYSKLSVGIWYQGRYSLGTSKRYLLNFLFNQLLVSAYSFTVPRLRGARNRARTADWHRQLIIISTLHSLLNSEPDHESRRPWKLLYKILLVSHFDEPSELNVSTFSKSLQKWL